MPVDSPDDLYGLPLEQFIPERAALAKALRAEKRRDEAQDVAGRRKPSVAAWAVNQLVRTQASAMQALFQAGDDLIRAQTDVAAGQGTGAAIRDATRRQRDALHDLLPAAEGLLSSDGHPLSQATLERVSDTLRAAAIDADARRQVQDGCLVRELRFVGVGVGGGTAAPPVRPAPNRAPPVRPAPHRAPRARTTPHRAPQAEAPAATDTKAADTKAATAKAAKEAKEAEAHRRRRRQAARKQADHALAEARRRATRAEKELAAARHRRDEADAALTDASRRLRAAEETAEAAVAALHSAEETVAELADQDP